MSDLDIKRKKFVNWPRRPHNGKTGDFMSLTGLEQLRKMKNTGKACKTVFQSEICACDVLKAVVILA